MQSRLLKSSQQHEFVAAQFSGANESSYQPLGDNVLVAPDTAAEKTSGGIMLTPDSVEKMTLAAETGVIVALGSDAFLWSSDRSRKWEGLKPKVGDRIYVQRYSGQLLLGKDQKIYRVMSDTCVAAVEIAEESGEADTWMSSTGSTVCVPKGKGPPGSSLHWSLVRDPAGDVAAAVLADHHKLEDSNV